MRVLHIMTGFPYEEDTVLTPWMWSLLKSLQSRGVDITVLAASHEAKESVDLWGMRVHRFRYAPGPLERFTYEAAIPEMLKNEPRLAPIVPAYIACGMWQAWRLSRREHFDVVQVHWPLPLALLGELFRRRGTPIIHTYYTAELALAERTPKLGPVFRALARSCDVATANSSFTAAMVDRLAGGGVSALVLPNSAALDSVTMNPPRGAPTTPRLLFVGRLVERKGLTYLLEAIAQLRNTRPQVELTIIGRGPLEDSLQAMARDLQIEDAINFRGWVTSDELHAAYGEAEVFVLPAIVDSRGDTEGLGVVLLEALQAGTPIIASRVGGIVDIVQHERTGLLVEEKSPQALCAAIERLMSDDGLADRLVIAGQQHMQDNFTADNIANRLVDLYRSLSHRSDEA